MRHTVVLLSPRSPWLSQSHPIPSQGPRHLTRCGPSALQAEEAGLPGLPAPRQGRCLSPGPRWAQRHFLTCALELHQDFQRTKVLLPLLLLQRTSPIGHKLPGCSSLPLNLQEEGRGSLSMPPLHQVCPILAPQVTDVLLKEAAQLPAPWDTQMGCFFL